MCAQITGKELRGISLKEMRKISPNRTQAECKLLVQRMKQVHAISQVSACVGWYDFEHAKIIPTERQTHTHTHTHVLILHAERDQHWGVAPPSQRVVPRGVQVEQGPSVARKKRHDSGASDAQSERNACVK